MNRCCQCSASFLLSLSAAVSAAAADDSVRAVYQFDSGDEQARRGLVNIRNHLQADPSAKIVVVALADGINFLREGEKTAGGYPFELIVRDLMEKGVKFDICDNTLESLHIDKSKIIDNVVSVQSGFAELARLQFVEHYAYLKP